MTQYRFTELFSLPWSISMSRATDAYLALSFIHISANVILDYRSGGNPWKQGDWLINNAGGEVRRGDFGSAIIEMSDYFESSPLLIVVSLQVTVLLVLFVSFRLLVISRSNSLTSVLLIISPAIFTVFWFADPQGSMRKELFSFAGLSLCALASIQERRMIFWLGISFLCIGFISHEAMVLFLPTFFGILIITGFHKTAPRHALVASTTVICFSFFSFVFAMKSSQIPDIGLVCVPLLERGLDQSICGGAISRLSHDTTFGYQHVMSRLNAGSLGGFLIAYAAALAPIFYIFRISKQPVRNGALLVLAALPFVPLYFIAIDWGRWMSFHIFSMTILLACAMRKNKFQQNSEPSIKSTIWLTVISFLIAPHHTIGILWGGVISRVGEDIWRIIS